MNLSELEEDYGNFYAPIFQVRLGGEDLVREHYLGVTSVEINLKQKAASNFSFKVANAFDWKDREFVAGPQENKIDLIELFAFGSTVEVKLGYGDIAGLVPLVQGVITEIATSFSESGSPELNISGIDKLFPLTVGRKTRNWENRRDSDIVKILLEPTGLDLNVQDTDPVRERIDQSQQTDLDFLVKLSERNAATFYTQNRSFYFGPRNNDRDNILELAWGKGLLSFSPQANLAAQIATVEVSSTSVIRGEPILGRATRGEESGRDTGRESGAERVAQALGRESVMRIRASVYTQEEADALARAILEERAQEFVTGDGQCIGLPEIVPDINVAFHDIGRVFSKTYYVSEATHKIDANGYRTTFKVEEATV